MESKGAKRRRYRLREKMLYGGVEEAEAFGEKLYLRGEERLNLSLRDPVRRRNQALPFIRDGARRTNEIAGGPTTGRKTLSDSGQGVPGQARDGRPGRYKSEGCRFGGSPL
ncbi:MAG: hypothetical protein ACE5II_05565 [Anaerolineae bacterium]